jgi:hypothetical protein
MLWHPLSGETLQREDLLPSLAKRFGVMLPQPEELGS